MTDKPRARILVVDDVDDVREAALAILSSAGYAVLSAGGAEEALSVLRQEPAHDLLFTDIVMGKGLNGFELGRYAILVQPALKVLYATGYAQNLDSLHAAVPGSRLIPKPYRAAQLLAEVALLLSPGAPHEGRPPQERALPAASRPRQEPGKAVLIVEDDTRSCAIATDLFMTLGLVAFGAGTAGEALALLAAHPEIAVLFADIRLPGMTGLELAEVARRLRPALNVVLTSAYDDGASPMRWRFVPKPWRLSDFRHIAGSLVRH